MSTYLFINLLIVIVPLLFSFESKLKFYKKIPSYLFSIIIVSTGFIIWDSIAAARGDWGFHTEHILGVKFLYLPIEEYLFFLTVPYSCLFIFETIGLYINDAVLVIRKSVFFFIALLIIMAAIIFRGQYYTSTVLLFTASFLIIAVLFFQQLIQSTIYWLTIVVTFIPFLIFNFVLTYIPVVIYSQNSIWGIRFISIPIEDFFYSYSMISFWILVYLLKEKKIKFTLNFIKR